MLTTGDGGALNLSTLDREARDCPICALEMDHQGRPSSILVTHCQHGAFRPFVRLSCVNVASTHNHGSLRVTMKS